jgi:hypothetical protein
MIVGSMSLFTGYMLSVLETSRVRFGFREFEAMSFMVEQLLIKKGEFVVNLSILFPIILYPLSGNCPLVSNSFSSRRFRWLYL